MDTHLRGIDEKVWRELRVEAVQRGISVAKLIEELWSAHQQNGRANSVALRRSLRISQAELSRRLGHRFQSTLNNWERGRSKVPGYVTRSTIMYVYIREELRRELVKHGLSADGFDPHVHPRGPCSICMLPNTRNANAG